jgi:hypothetical protein
MKEEKAEVKPQEEEREVSEYDIKMYIMMIEFHKTLSSFAESLTQNILTQHN